MGDMSDTWAVELLLAESGQHYEQDRYGAALRAAEAAREAAEALDDMGLVMRAMVAEAAAHKMLGDHRRALARHTEVLTLAEDPQHASIFASETLARCVARSYMHWVECGRFLPEVPMTGLFGVLDQGEAWLRGTGRGAWRAGLCLERAKVLDNLGRPQEAVGFAEEALALAERQPNAPGCTLATHRWSLGDLLRKVGRVEDAEVQYGRVLDAPASAVHDRFAALVGLAWCALKRGALVEAQAHAAGAVREAEGLGSNVLCPALHCLVAAHRRAGDRAAARAAATRHLGLARSLGTYRLYFALRNAADVALDDGDRAGAEMLLAELEPFARALDESRGVTTFAAEVAQRRLRMPTGAP